MDAVQRVGIERAGAVVVAFTDRVVPILYEEMRLEIGRRAMSLLVRQSPVGDAKVDRHPGKYRASHTVGVGSPRVAQLPDMPNYPIPGDAEVESELAGSDPAASLFIANAASDGSDGSYAGLLEGGRRQYTRLSTGRSQWIGSTQAPEGIYGPTVALLKGQREQIAAVAVANAERRL